MRPFSKRVVDGLPRSWQRAPSISASCRGRSSPRSSRSVGRRVHDLQRVRPHVALGVPARVLGRRLEGQELRRDHRKHAPRLQEGEAERRPPRLEQQLLDLPEDALGRQLGEGHRRAQGGGGRVHLQLEARGELHGAERPQRVLAERPRVHGAQDAGLEVAPTAPRVDDLAGRRVEEHRVHREVAAARGLLDREGGIALDRDAAVAGAHLRVAPRQRHVERALDAFDARELVDAERLPDRVHPAVSRQQRLQAVRRQPEDLDVVVLDREARGSRRAPPRRRRTAVPPAARRAASSRTRPGGSSRFMAPRLQQRHAQRQLRPERVGR